MSDFRDYENGVADVIASIFGEDAVVRRNVHLPGKRSGRTRQVDILVEGKIFKLTDATMIVDCKRWKKNLDVADVETFISAADDIGCDIGIIVTSSGASQTALTRARSERGIAYAHSA